MDKEMDEGQQSTGAEPFSLSDSLMPAQRVKRPSPQQMGE